MRDRKGGGGEAVLMLKKPGQESLVCIQKVTPVLWF